ncbi:methyltransferase domain-containing protein [Halorhabdus sp. BNX81]|uniref:methyltransferase domain-containing protein n=1 Tax=Halorhabdus sp. BNX81 TaxID=2980181 RepID=UPI0023DD64D2|nr:methyltransferase domain-containing protein [Halorhabdus sp. BNX81]WEL20522.1 SAM-dependent methyltransferase [Halorhabdus sp. BNX81]
MSDGNDWDPAAYEDHAFVYEYGESLLSLLDPQPGERILDIGCGTGELTAEIAASEPEVVGIDSSAEMIDAARDRHSEPTFRVADATAFDPDESFDAVFSNAAFHWIDDQDALLSTIADALVPGGRLVAEFGGRGNVAAINGALQSALRERGYDAELPWYFASIDEYAPRLSDHGFEVRLARLFDRPTELEGGENGLRQLYDMFCDDLLDHLDDETRAAVISDAEDALREEYFDGETWTADYRRLRIVAVKE